MNLYVNNTVYIVPKLATSDFLLNICKKKCADILIIFQCSFYDSFI